MPLEHTTLTFKDTFNSEYLGELSDVSATGANDVWHIKNNDKETLINFEKQKRWQLGILT